MNIESPSQKNRELLFEDLTAKKSFIYLKPQISMNLSTASTNSSQSSSKRVKFNPTIEYCAIPSTKRFNLNHLNYKTVKTSKDIVIIPDESKKCFCIVI